MQIFPTTSTAPGTFNGSSYLRIAVRKDSLKIGPVLVYKTEGRPRIALISHLRKYSLKSDPV